MSGYIHNIESVPLHAFIIEVDDAQARPATSPLGDHCVRRLNLKFCQQVKVSESIVHLRVSRGVCRL